MASVLDAPAISAVRRLVPVNAEAAVEAEPEAGETPEPEADELRFPPVAPTVADLPSARTELISITTTTAAQRQGPFRTDWNTLYAF